MPVSGNGNKGSWLRKRLAYDKPQLAGQDDEPSYAVQEYARGSSEGPFIWLERPLLAQFGVNRILP